MPGAAEMHTQGLDAEIDCLLGGRKQQASVIGKIQWVQAPLMLSVVGLRIARIALAIVRRKTGGAGGSRSYGSS